MLRGFWILLLVFMTGCAAPIHFQQPLGFLHTATPAPVIQTVPPLANTATPVVTETPSGPVECAFVLASHEQPALSEQVNQAFRSAGLVNVEARAAAYGEDCLDTNTQKMAGFSAMQTDFYVDVAVQDTEDRQVMGEWIEKVLRILYTLPPGQMAGPNPGYVGVSFANGTQKVSLWFPRVKAKNLIDQGTRGADLFEALNMP